jgi:hypothetical protein
MLPGQHVEQLRQLVEAGLAQEAADARDARVVVTLKAGPLRSFRSSNCARNASASRTIVRNL